MFIYVKVVLLKKEWVYFLPDKEKKRHYITKYGSIRLNPKTNGIDGVLYYRCDFNSLHHERLGRDASQTTRGKNKPEC